MDNDLASRDSFEACVLPLRGRLRGSALALCRSSAEADDLVQETVLRAWRFWPKYRQGSNCSAWLQRILRNVFINRYRALRREREILGLVRDTQLARADIPPDGLDAVGMGDEVKSEISALSSEFQTILLMVDVEGCSYREAASAAGCPIGTVMSRLHRARNALRSRLAPYALAHGYA